jgi:hypothetical protein
MSSVALIVLAANFTAYPAFGDRGVTTPRSAQSNSRVEATIDRGPISELVVRCRSGSAIISYSKVERVYCSPRHQCDRQLAALIKRTCG